jgi:hypothetical protein
MKTAVEEIITDLEIEKDLVKIERTILEFEEAKRKATSFKDIIYINNILNKLNEVKNK